TRLMREGGRRSALENALAWLADGVALLRADGTIAYANDAFHALARRGDGLRISGEAIEFTATEARRRFESALGTVGRLGDPRVARVQPTFRFRGTTECRPISFRCARLLAKTSSLAPM